MKPHRKKEILKKLTVLNAYFLSKMMFDDMFNADEFDKLIYKGYAKRGRKIFFESLPKEELAKLEKSIGKNVDKKNAKEMIRFMINFLYIFIVSDEKTEFDELNKYYDESSDEIEAFQKKMIKKVFKTNTTKWMFKMTDKEKFVSERVNDYDSKNFIGKVFRVGISNKFFTREELIEFYSDYENEFIK
jgi:hypothetical protein